MRRRVSLLGSPLTGGQKTKKGVNKPFTVRILSRSLMLSPSLQLKPLKLMRRRKTLQPMLISQMMILKRMKKSKNPKIMKRKKTMKRQSKTLMKMVWGMLRMVIWSNRNKGQLICLLLVSVAFLKSSMLYNAQRKACQCQC